jgi:hypothetical protein
VAKKAKKSAMPVPQFIIRVFECLSVWVFELVRVGVFGCLSDLQTPKHLNTQTLISPVP